MRQIYKRNNHGKVRFHLKIGITYLIKIENCTKFVHFFINCKVFICLQFYFSYKLNVALFKLTFLYILIISRNPFSSIQMLPLKLDCTCVGTKIHNLYPQFGQILIKIIQVILFHMILKLQVILFHIIRILLYNTHNAT